MAQTKVVQNGNLSSGQPTHRPVFRRQGSSYTGAGPPSPMALMLVPTTSKVDYSMTKGGLRLWAVVFVFIFMCSSLYTVFSAHELAELAVDFDGDGDVDLDHDVDDDDEIVGQKRAEHARTPTKDFDTSSTGSDLKRGHDAASPTKSHEAERGAEDDDKKSAKDRDEKDEPEDEGLTEEDLFSSLKAKLEQKYRQITSSEAGDGDGSEETGSEEKPLTEAQKRRLRRVMKTGVAEERSSKEKEHHDEEEDDTPAPERQKKKKKSRIEKVEKTIEEDKSAEEEDDDDKEEAVVKEVKVHRVKGKKSVEEEQPSPAEVDEQETGEDDAPQQQPKSSLRKRGKKKSAESESSPGSRDDEQPEETVAEDDEEHEQPPRPVKVIRRKGKRSWATVSRGKESGETCVSRGDCPDSREDDNDDDDDDDEDEQPRSTRRRIKRRRYAILAATDDDDDDAEVDSDDGQKLDEQIETAVASIKKIPLKNRNSYKRHAITNRDDHKFRDLLDSADYLVEKVWLCTNPSQMRFSNVSRKHEMGKAFAIYEQVLAANPKSPRAHFGMARAYDIQSEHKQSNKMLELAIHSYETVVENSDTPDELFKQAAERITERARFRGWMVKAVKAQRAMLDRFPDDVNLLNEFGVTFLMMGRNDDAKKVFHDILQIDPLNGFAQAHYGFILKVVDGDLEEGVKYLRKGLKSRAPGTQDGRFYFHLGDGLQRQGRSAEAYRVYEEGAELGLFLSKYQRSLYNVDTLESRPWWTTEQTTYGRYLKAIEKQWMIIRDEGLSVLDAKTQTFEDEDESLTVKGDWKQFTLYSKGRRHDRNCAKTPRTCKAVEAFSAATKCTRGQIKFSVMQGGTRVWPHCGPTNCRLRGHLGLVVPPEPRIRVANETRSWKQGRFLIFDDSFEHEVWHDGQAFRLVLIVDMWHPDLSPEQRQQLSPI